MHIQPLMKGLKPEKLPSEDDFIRANGPRIGAMKWKDMRAQIQYGGVIGAAKDLTQKDDKTFLNVYVHRIQTHHGFAANQQRWEKMQAKFKEMDKEWEIQQGRNRFVSSMQNNPAGPERQNNQAAVDRYFAQDIAPSFSYI